MESKCQVFKSLFPPFGDKRWEYEYPIQSHELSLKLANVYRKVLLKF